MIDLYLRAATEEALLGALSFLRYGDDQKVLTGSVDYALDLIGPVYGPVRGYSAQEKQRIEKAKIIASEFHANLRCSDRIARKVPRAIQITPPATPYRVWA